MKFRWDKKYLYWGVTAFCVIACCLVFYWIVTDWSSLMKAFHVMTDILSPVLYAFVFSFLLAPVCNFLESKCFGKLAARMFKRKPDTAKKAARGCSVAGAMIFGLLVLAALLYLLLPQLYTSIEALLTNMPDYVESGTRQIQSWTTTDSALGKELLGLFNGVYQNLSTFLSSSLLPSIDVLVAGISAGVVSVFKVIFNFFVGLVITIYLLCSKEHFIAQAKKLTYCIFPRKFSNALLKNASLTYDMFGDYITVRLIESVIVGIVNYIVMLIFGLHYAALISVIVGVTNIIPFFGPYIGAIPSALLLLLVDPVECLIFIVAILIIQQLDGNVLDPLLLGNRTGLNSFWVMVALLVGGGLFGLIGIICAVPLFAVFFTIVRTLINEHLRKKQLPVDTGKYYNMQSLDVETGRPIPHPPKVKRTAEEKKAAILKKTPKEKEPEKDNKS